MLSKTVFHGIATSSLVFSFPKTHTFSLKGRPYDIYKYRITVSLFLGSHFIHVVEGLMTKTAFSINIRECWSIKQPAGFDHIFRKFK